MPKARKRKDTQFNNKMSKCVFLYGEPTNDKAAKIRKMQAEFVNPSVIQLPRDSYIFLSPFLLSCC